MYYAAHSSYDRADTPQAMSPREAQIEERERFTFVLPVMNVQLAPNPPPLELPGIIDFKSDSSWPDAKEKLDKLLE